MAQDNFPFEIRFLNEEDEKFCQTVFKGLEGQGDVCFVGPKKYVLDKKIKEQGPIFYNFEARPTDIWLFGYPRSGTTLSQEMVYLLGSDFDYKKAGEKILDVRFPVLESSLYRNEDNLPEYLERAKGTSLSEDFIVELTTSCYKYLKESEDKRFIKTHLPFSLVSPKILTTGCKIIYVARNPKDVMLSMYRYAGMSGDTVDLKTFWKLFKRNSIVYTPYFEHLKEGWALRNNKNVLFMFYEEILKDQRKAIRKVADFLGKKPTSEQIEKLVDHLRIENFKTNKTVNNDHLVELGLYEKNEEHSFIWKGKPGGWKAYFDEELKEEFDTWVAENLHATDLKLPTVN